MRPARLLVVAALLCVATGCTDDPDDGPAPTDPAEPARLSVAFALDELPDPGDDPLTITVVNVASAFAAQVDWMTDVLSPPANVARLDQEAFLEAAGFSWDTSDWFASVSAPPDEFSLYSGSGRQTDGTETLGEGDDYETSLDGDRTVDPLGRPLHLATARDLLATSLSTPMIEGWVEDGGELGDDESLAAVADVLDEAQPVSAYLQTLDGDVATVGIGWTVEDDEPVVTIGYDLGSDDAASAAADAIATSYAEGTSLVTQQPYAELLGDAAVEVHGRVVVVTVHPEADRAGVPLRMIAQRDLPGLS